MPKHLIVIYKTLQEMALAAFPVPFPVSLMLGHDTHTTEAFLLVTPGSEAISPSGPSVSLPLAEMLYSPTRHPIVTRTLREHCCFREASECQVTLSETHRALYLLHRVYHNCHRGFYDYVCNVFLLGFIK